MFSNIKGIFSSNYVGVVTRHRDAICVRLYIFSLGEYFLSAARLRAAADRGEQVQAAARGQEQQEQEERQKTR